MLPPGPVRTVGLIQSKLRARVSALPRPRRPPRDARKRTHSALLPWSTVYGLPSCPARGNILLCSSSPLWSIRVRIVMVRSTWDIVQFLTGIQVSNRCVQYYRTCFPCPISYHVPHSFLVSYSEQLFRR